MAKEKSLSAPWTMSCPDQAPEPKGPTEAAIRAISLLGPFKYRTHDEADRYARPDNGSGIRVSEELAIDRVYALARMFNHLQILEDGAPRRKDIVERLNRIEDVSAELADLLATADDISLLRLHTGGSGIGLFRKFFGTDLMKEADVDGLQTLSKAGERAVPGRWVARLAALSQYVGEVRTNFLISKGIEDPDRVDRGGNTNLVREEFGSARYQLVQEGWHVFDMFRPDEARGTEGGQFYLFLCAVFELATGLDPEDHITSDLLT